MPFPISMAQIVPKHTSASSPVILPIQFPPFRYASLKRPLYPAKLFAPRSRPFVVVNEPDVSQSHYDLPCTARPEPFDPGTRTRQIRRPPAAARFLVLPVNMLRMDMQTELPTDWDG